MVDKCLQTPPPFRTQTQQLDSSTSQQIPSGHSIEDQLNSKGEPPEEPILTKSTRRGSSKIHQMMSYNYEGRLLGDRDLERLRESSVVEGQEEEEEEETVLKSTESDGKLSEEEVQSMISGKSKSTVKSTPQDWFKELNTEVQEHNNFALYDDDPPYYLPNESLRRKHHLGPKPYRPHKLSKSSSGAMVRGRRVGGEGLTMTSSQCLVNGLAVPTKIMDTGPVVESTSDSNSDSYRSVIDDLTIKNQKLKRRLKKLEEFQAEHLQGDKVFELRIHGLSQTKRQELENLLQQFTSTLNNSPGSSRPSLTDSPPATSTGSSFGPSTVVTSDSAYASNMGSGTASLAATSTHPSLASGKSGESRHSKGSYNATSSGRGTVSSGSSGGVNGKKVATFISEKAKMKQVVRRLEYLFTGKRSQDQYLALNRQQSKATSSDSDDVVGSLDGQDSDGKDKSTSGMEDLPVKSPELDSRLPQIPAQNVEYLHNLTSTSPTHEPISIGGHWDGWVYLNLVMNLAQLHTINVTVPFVKKAISSMSVKLELSPDGKMVRWKGGLESSNLASESENKSEINSSPLSSSQMDASSEASRGRKRSDGSYSQTDFSSIPGGMPIDIKIPHSMESSSTRLSRSHDSGTRSSPSSQNFSGFHYKPLFAQSKSFDDDSSEPSETSYSSSSGMKSSSSPDGASGDYSGSGGRTRSKKPTVGPIIYYENGRFCTDLSAQEVVPRDESTTPEYPYERMTNEVVGAAAGDNNTDSLDQNSRPLLRPLAPLETLVEGQLLGGRPRGGSGLTDEDDYGDSDGIEFSPKLESTLPDDPPLPVELEASGIGGVQPEDNFAINVQVKHYLLPRGSQTLNTRKLKSKLRGITHRIPQSSIDVFLRDEAGMGTLPTTRPRSRSASTSPSPPRPSSSDGGPPLEPLRHELVSARFIRLPPSTLPPASYMYFSSPSSDESRSDSDSLNSSNQSDSFSEFQGNDVLTDDSQDIRGNKHSYGGRSASRRSNTEDDMEETSSTGSSRMVESVASSKLVVGSGRGAPILPAHSSAATAGSEGESMEGVDEDDEEDDDDEISQNTTSVPYYHKNDSDEAMDDFGPDDESLEGVEDAHRPNLKRARSSKSSAVSTPALRNSKSAR